MSLDKPLPVGFLPDRCGAQLHSVPVYRPFHLKVGSSVTLLTRGPLLVAAQISQLDRE
jgi:hypothetical protein